MNTTDTAKPSRLTELLASLRNMPELVGRPPNGRAAPSQQVMPLNDLELGDIHPVSAARFVACAPAAYACDAATGLEARIYEVDCVDQLGQHIHSFVMCTMPASQPIAAEVHTSGYAFEIVSCEVVGGREQTRSPAEGSERRGNSAHGAEQIGDF